MRKRFFLLITLGLLLGLLAACASTDAPTAGETPLAPEATAAPTEPPLEAPTLTIGNEAMLESVQVTVTGSDPAEVAVEINGNLPDGCTTIAAITPTREGDAFEVTISTQRDSAALCTQALVPFTERVVLDVADLPAETYSLTVVGWSGTMTETFTLNDESAPVEATPTPAPTSAPSAELTLPAACRPQEDQETPTAPFVNVQDGYCFQYPADAGFQVKDVLPPGIAAVWGPPLTPSFEPIRAGLTVYKQEPAGGRSPGDIIEALLAENPGAEVVNAEATFAGEPAQVVEGMPGMMDSQRYYLIHDDFFFGITLVPLTTLPEYEEAVTAQRELLWQTISNSFTWLPAEVSEQFAGCPAPEGNGPTPSSPYVNARQAYCLLYPSHYQQQESAALDMAIFTGPALDPTIPEPLQGRVTIEVPEAAGGRTVEEVVGELLAVVTGLNIQTSETTLDGEPAILITGLPARSEGRDLYVVHNDMVFRLRVEPLGFPELANDLEGAWELITGSFHFLR